MYFSRLTILGLAAALVVSLGTPALAYDSSVDTSFADGGHLTLRNTWLPRVVSDGTHTYVVTASNSFASKVSVVVRSLDGEGQQDPDFGTDGRATLKPGGDFIDQAVAIDQRGRLLIAGQSGRRFVVARLTRSGELDRTFSGDGHRRLGPRDSFPTGIEVDSQGRLLVLAADYDSSGARTRFATLVYRLRANGGLDQLFGRSGHRELALKGLDAGHAISVDGADRPVITGWQQAHPGRAWVVRLTAPRGRPDPNFSEDGLATVRFGSDLIAYGSALRAHDGVVTVGAVVYAGTPSRHSLAAFQLDADGTLDSGYGEGGRARFPQPKKVVIDSMYVDDDGAVIAGGKRRIDPDISVPLVGALTPSGALDAEMGLAGTAEIDIGNGSVGVSDLAVSDGQILAAIHDLGRGRTFVTRLGVAAP